MTQKPQSKIQASIYKSLSTLHLLPYIHIPTSANTIEFDNGVSRTFCLFKMFYQLEIRKIYDLPLLLKAASRFIK